MSSISLRSIIEQFSYPISEEQTWAICYLTVLDLKSLPGPWIYRPENISKSKFSENSDSDALPMEAVQISRSGEVKINRRVLSSRFDSNESGTGSPTTDSDSSDDMLLRMNATSNATEYDLIAPIAIMLYNALDYKLSDEEERQLAPSLSNLIEVMLDVSEEVPTSDSPCFGDDLSDSPYEFENENLGRLASPPFTPLHPSFSSQHSPRLSNLIGLNEVLERCKAHFREVMASFSDGHLEMVIHSHYINVCKSLVDEFYRCNIMLDNLQYNDGLRNWERIVESLESRDYELRNSKVFPSRSSTLPNLQPDATTLEVMQSQIKNFKKDSLKRVQTNTLINKTTQKPDPFNQTLDNIKNKKYNLKPVSERILNEKPEAIRRVSTPHEMLMEQIQQAPPLKEVPPEFKRRYTIDLHKVKYQKQYNTPKRYYPPRTSLEETITEDELYHSKRQGIVHGRSVSLPYERVNKVPSYKVPINHNLGDACSSSTSGSDPNDSPPWSVNSRCSPVYSDATSLCSLDYPPPPYYVRPSSSASAGLLEEMETSRYRGDLYSSRDTVINSDDSLYEGRSNSALFYMLQNENPLYQTSPFSSEMLCSSYSLSREKKRKHKRRLERPATAEIETEYNRNYSPNINTGASRLQELAHTRDLWVQNTLADLSERHPTLYLDTVFGRLCFVCSTRFTWKKWASHCKLCNRKVCANCKITKVLPPNFINSSPTFNDSKRKEGKKILVCQHCNIFLFNEFNEPISDSQNLFNAPQF